MLGLSSQIVNLLRSGGDQVGLSAKKNSDGSWTVSCGGDSLTIGGSGGSGAGASGSGPIIVFPNPTPNTGGVTAYIDWRKPNRNVEPVSVSNSQQLIGIIKDAFDAGTPKLLQLHWTGEEPLELSDISNAIGQTSNQDLMRVEILV
jgi:hypothetical protein